MPGPLVSVVIPCYRQGRWLREAVDSVLGQSHQPVQVIVVNDGSDDNTDTVARNYGDQIRYIATPNGGVATARNEGLRHVEGKYVLFLDADDVLHSDAVSWLIAALQDSEDRLAVMGYRWFTCDPAVEPEHAILFGTGPTDDGHLLYKCFGPPGVYLCPARMVAEVGGFEQSVHPVEDWDLFLRLTLNGATLCLVKRVGLYYRRHPGSASTNPARNEEKTARVAARTLKAICNKPAIVQSWGLEPAAVTRKLNVMIGQALLDAAYNYRRQGQYRESFRIYREGIRRDCINPLVWRGLAALVAHRVRDGLGGDHGVARIEPPVPATLPNLCPARGAVKS